jgi:hypothetical protein
MVTANILFAQTYSIPGLQRSMSDIVRESKVNKGVMRSEVQTFTSETEGSQFFYPVFSDGAVISAKNDTFSNVYLFLFDKVYKQLYLINRADRNLDNPMITQVAKDQIKGFMIRTPNGLEHWFTAARLYDPSNFSDFYEVMVQRESGYTLLKKITTKFIPANSEDASNVKKGEFRDEFKDDYTYFVSFKNGKETPIEIRRKKVAEAFPSTLKPYFDYYFSQHFQEEFDAYYVARMVYDLNSQYYH